MDGDDRVGQLIDGRYRLESKLAEGGMGAVYVAEHVNLRKRVAIKFLHRDVADVPGIAVRFEREARATSQLDHPHIIHVSDFGRASDGALYLVMELLVGRSLSELLEEKGSLSVERAVAITDQILAGLQAAHLMSVVHRDLKPDNIFLRDDATDTDDVKLLDFGIAAIRGEQHETRLTQTGAVMGTPAYMAPEQAMGHRDADARTDLHAVGVMLYEMLSGKPPYAGDNYHQVLHAIIVGKPIALEQLRPGLPPRIYAAVARAMAADPATRFADAAAFRAAIKGELPKHADASTPPEESDFKLPRALLVTDLRGPKIEEPYAPAPNEPSAAPAAPAATPAAFAPVDLPALELDRPPIAESRPPPPPPSVAPKLIAGALITLVLSTGLALGWRRLQAPHDSIVELTNAPFGARLLLDGTRIEGTRLQLPISAETHELVVQMPHRPPRTITFTAERSRTIDLAAPF